MGQMKWERETSENCHQDNAIKNPCSVHRVRRRPTTDRIRNCWKNVKKGNDEEIQKSFKGSRAAAA